MEYKTYNMELLITDSRYILKKNKKSLWCDRRTGRLEAKPDAETPADNKVACLGLIFGIIGKIKFHPDNDWKLVTIVKWREVGKIYPDIPVFQIEKVHLLPLGSDSPGDIETITCPNHKNIEYVNRSASTQKPLSKIKGFAETLSISSKKLQDHLSQFSSKISTTSIQKENKDLREKDRIEKRCCEEFLKLFNESQFFYTSTGDITNTLEKRSKEQYNKDLWNGADHRFVWNKEMMKDLVDKSLTDYDLIAPWLVPVMQGYVEIQRISVTQHDNINKQLNVAIISRRSCNRAGTRYKRRGVDLDGNCANYVETEQIVTIDKHAMSFVQIRGSVPVFWTQSGIKYKPPPKIVEDDIVNEAAFKTHLAVELSQYKKLVAISLIEQSGKESILHEEYLKFVEKFNSQDFDFIAFDFHEYCKGMRYENMSILLENIYHYFKELKYYWISNKETLCQQGGVFRVNCVDCLDRTNVVQSAIAKLMLEIQCRRIVVLEPEEKLSSDFKRKFQQIWANNGDAISKQYAGTAALKGDFTRTGERRFAGALKDGMNSANRYYLSQFRDIYRQIIIDLIIGNIKSEDLLTINTLEDILDKKEDAEKEAENLKNFIDYCKDLFICDPEKYQGGWGFIDIDSVTGDPQQDDMDIVILLSQRSIYIARYDDETDSIQTFQRIYLEDIFKVEVGTLKHRNNSQVAFKIYYGHSDECIFYTLRPARVRLFNNICIQIDTVDKAVDAIMAVVQSFEAARVNINYPLNVKEKCIFDKKPSAPHINVYSNIDAFKASNVESCMSRDISLNDMQIKKRSQKSQSKFYTSSPLNNLKSKVPILKDFLQKGLTSLNNKPKSNVVAEYSNSVAYSLPTEMDEIEERLDVHLKVSPINKNTKLSNKHAISNPELRISETSSSAFNIDREKQKNESNKIKTLEKHLSSSSNNLIQFDINSSEEDITKAANKSDVDDVEESIKNVDKKVSMPIIKISHSETSLKNHLFKDEKFVPSLKRLKFGKNENRLEMLQSFADLKKEESLRKYGHLKCKILVL